MDYSNVRDYRDISKVLKTGTTTVGLVSTEGVVIGADMRATMDTFIANSEVVKVYKISDILGITTAGMVGDLEYLVKILRMQNDFYRMDEGRSMSPTSATSLLSLILQENKMFPYLAQLIIGGLNKGEPEIFSIDPFGGYTKESKFTATGSGTLSALGYIESIYAPSMGNLDAVRHAAKAIQIAMRRDSATGDGTRIVSITKKGGYKEYTKEELDKIVK
jgi:proteasome beta subunit